MHSPIFTHQNNQQEQGLELCVYFSLPFYPFKNKTYFYHGHMALGIEDHIYQIYNPHMLKSDFILSKMPAKFWLYDKIRNWVDRDKNSPTYSYVSLYSTCETERTRIFYIRFMDVKRNNIEKYKSYLACLNEQFEKKEINFKILENNCVSILRSIFYDEGILKKRNFDLFPFVTFERMIQDSIRGNRRFEAGIVKGEMSDKFRLHRFCLGLLTLSPERHLLKRLEKMNTLYG